MLMPLEPIVRIASLTLAVVLAPPNQGSAPRSDDDHRHGVDEAVGAAIGFDEAVGAAANTPRVVGYEQAAADKREIDSHLPAVPWGPQVQILAGGRVYPSDVTGVEIQITATQAWSLEGYGRKRKEAAKAENELLDVEARAQALDQRLAAAHAWIMLHAAERELDLAQAELDTLRQLGDALERGRQAGVGTRADVADARAREAAAELRVGDLRGLVHDLGLVLAREIGGDTSMPMRTLGDYPKVQLPSEDELRRLFAQLESLPRIARQRLRARAEHARAAELKAAQATQLNAGGSFQRESASDIVLFAALGAQFTPGKGERARGHAVAAAREAEATGDAELLMLEAMLTTAIHDLRHTQSQVEILEAHTVPAHIELLDSHTQALQLGEGTVAPMLDARARLDAVQRDLTNAEALWVWARVQVWLYEQALLSEGASPEEANK